MAVRFAVPLSFVSVSSGSRSTPTLPSSPRRLAVASLVA